MTTPDPGLRVFVTRAVQYNYSDYFFEPDGVAQIEFDPERLKGLPDKGYPTTEHVAIDIYRDNEDGEVEYHNRVTKTIHHEATL